MMRTTVDIREPLLSRAKALAAASGRRLGDVVNDALAELLARHEHDTNGSGPIELPVFRGSGFRPGIDPRSNASLLEAMEENEPTSGRGGYARPGLRAVHGPRLV